MEAYRVFGELALIIVAAKVCGMAARRLKAPQVVGEIIAGLLLGPSMLGLVNKSDFLNQMAEIGVVLLMFSAGLETRLEDLKRTGVKAFLIACCGVFIPLALGTLLYMGFYGVAPIGSEAFLQAVFTGVIMTATSVSITVQTLKEMGKLSSEIGTTIMSAAIIDDVIGILVLTVVIGMKNPGTSISGVFGSTVAFFAISLVLGMVIYKVFKRFDEKYPHHQRIPIFSLALCFTFAYCAERFFGIADITGAFVAGIILCNIRDSKYISTKVDMSSYLLFGPVFFASIGIKTAIDELSMGIVLFSAAFVVVALLSKIIGCGGIAHVLGYKRSDCLKIGVGMMTRGEVALIVAQKGLSAGLLSPVYFTAVIILIIVSSVITPLTLKFLYSKDSVSAPAVQA